MPAAPYDAPKPRLSAFEHFVYIYLSSGFVFAVRPFTAPQRFYPSTFHSLSPDFFFFFFLFICLLAPAAFSLSSLYHGYVIQAVIRHAHLTHRVAMRNISVHVCVCRYANTLLSI